MGDEKRNKTLALLEAEFAPLLAELQTAHLKSFDALLALAPKVVHAVEFAVETVGALSAQEKEDIVVHWLNERINIPLIPSQRLEEVILRFLVRMIVKTLNDTIGHVWPKRMSVDSRASA